VNGGSRVPANGSVVDWLAWVNVVLDFPLGNSKKRESLLTSSQQLVVMET